MKTTEDRVGYRLEVSYVGTPFAGWQRQKNAVTVQSELERVIQVLWGRRIPIEGSGRTDSGVHAIAQIVSFRAERKFSATVLLRALNAHLPFEIRVQKARVVSADFHARFQARAKRYEYRIWNAKVMDPFQINRVWHLPVPLDLARMRRAARRLQGRHDFSAFATNPGYVVGSTVRRIFSLRIVREGALVRVCVTANGFLHRMVRNLTGALVKVGHGRLSETDLLSVLKEGVRSKAPAGAPAGGLYMVRVYYGDPYPTHDPRPGDE